MKIGRYIIGLVSGLTFGMLFAPKQGKKLRDDIMKKSSESGAEGLKELGGAFLDAGEEAWSEIKNLSEHEQVEAFLDMSKEKLQQYLSTIEGKGYDVAVIAQNKLEEIAELAASKAKKFKSKVQKKTSPIGFKKRRVKKAAKPKKTIKKVAAKAKPKARKTTKRK
jgi:gas vesicle protein